MKIFRVKFVPSLLLLAISSSLFAEEGRHPLCLPLGGYAEDVCEVSMVRLFANPDEFEGRIVRVSGFFADGSVPLLFLDQTAYSISRTVDSVLLKVDSGRYANVLLRENRSLVVVIGRFSSKDRVIPKGASAERISGTIAVIEASRANEAWGHNDSPSSLMKQQTSPASE